MFHCSAHPGVTRPTAAVEQVVIRHYAQGTTRLPQADLLAKTPQTCSIESWRLKPDEVQTCSLSMCDCRLPVNRRSLDGFASYGLG
jgi:hypothetical protein